jgi:hypothetical protein
MSDARSNTPYRAAVWVPREGLSKPSGALPKARLTGPEEAHLSDEELIAKARTKMGTYPNIPEWTAHGEIVIVPLWQD